MVRLPRLFALSSLFLLLVMGSRILAQGTSGPRVSDSSVGYIDPAIPADVFRLRFDAADNNLHPTRGEFFYPKGGPIGPGLPEPEAKVDNQDLSAYLELAASERLSAFFNVPLRFLEPQINPSHAGLSDMDVGFKYAFVRDDERVATLQFRTYIPTGDSKLGLGNNHVTLEPGLLYYDRLADRLGLESELRLWVPIGGTDFASEIFRYGVGLHYDLYRTDRLTFTPVAEFVGWTLLGGKVSTLLPSGNVLVESAAGQTILNAKVGMRVKFGDWADLYGGYGRPLTGDRWYDNIARVEFRLFF
jgi:hypothetical protein